MTVLDLTVVVICSLIGGVLAGRWQLRMQRKLEDWAQAQGEGKISGTPNQSG